MASDEMVAWLRAVILADKERWWAFRATFAVGGGSLGLDAIARCEAEVAILDEYEARHNDVILMLGPDCERQREWAGLRLAVRLLGSGYQHRPGYREEWKP